MNDLANRAVACKHWRWMRGMSMTDECLVTNVAHNVPTVLAPQGRHGKDELPDLTDPATLGCLLALVREAWRCPTAYARQGSTRRASDDVLAWEVCDLWLDAEACRILRRTRQGSVQLWGMASETEALVAALEAAP